FHASLFVQRGKLRFAMGIGAWFQFGGIVVCYALGGPLWFNALDLITAYFPMAFLGYFLAKPKA
ncbi:MAG: hypothetical protein AAF483_30305, partial [Planctomycetota bacterium]